MRRYASDIRYRPCYAPLPARSINGGIIALFAALHRCRLNAATYYDVWYRSSRCCRDAWLVPCLHFRLDNMTLSCLYTSTRSVLPVGSSPRLTY